jgi:hypothetical protein
MALQFGKTGSFEVTVCPALVGVAEFIRLHKPVIEKRILMKRIRDDDQHTVWVGSLDGKVLDE